MDTQASTPSVLRCLLLTTAFAATGLSTAPAQASQLVMNPIGSPIHVDASSPPNIIANAPAVAIDSQGYTLVTWTSGSAYAGIDGWGTGIGGQFFAPDGSLDGINFVVNAGVQTNHGQGQSRVAVTPNDDFAVIWKTDYSQVVDTSFTAIHADTLYGPGPSGVVNHFHHYNQIDPDIAYSAQGDMVSVWRSVHENDYYWGVFVSHQGTQEIRVDQAPANQSNERPRVAMTDDGRFAVTYSRAGDIYMRLYDAAGVPVTGELIVHDELGYTQRDPDIAALSNGNYMVVWPDDNPIFDGSTNQTIVGRVFLPDGTPDDDVFVIHDDPGHQITPAIAATSGGRAVVVWQRTGYETRAQLLSPTGEPINDDIEAIGSSNCTVPAVATGGPDHEQVAVTCSVFVPGVPRDVMLQRFVIEPQV